MSFKLHSHPGYLLKDHLNGVYEKGMDIFRRNMVCMQDEVLIRLILLFHDLGKASSYFQEFIDPTIDKPYSDLKNHAEISANWFFYYARNYMQFDLKTAYLGYICIKKHHGDLEDFRNNADSQLKEKLLQINTSIDYQELRKIYESYFKVDDLTAESFVRLYEETPRVSRFTRKLTKQLSSKDLFRLNYLFSILLTADKGDAIWKKEFESKNSCLVPNTIVDTFKQRFTLRHDMITRIRNDSYREAERCIDKKKRIFSLNLPTGSGKTLNLMNVALKMREQEDQKIIYCLPFTSVIDQNMAVFEDVLKYNEIGANTDVILKHHHLSDFRYRTNSETYDSNKAEFLIENWDAKIVVTTFHQLLLTVFSNRNRMLKKFHALANSIIILDEVQSVPFRYWEIINRTFQQLSELLNIRFILGTATMPLIFDESRNEIYELAQSKQDYFSALNRIKIDCSYMKNEMTIAGFAKILIEQVKLNSNKSRLVIVNTIKSSLELYKLLKEELGSENLIYLSTNVIPAHRLQRISTIKNCAEGKTIISTQLVEAGVDIDIDIVYRDFAPLDSIFQACGRCNRNDSNSHGVVYLINLINENGKNFSSFIYDRFLLNQTQNCLKEKEEVPEADFLKISTLYYQKIKENKSETLSEELRKEMDLLHYEKAFSYPQHKNAFHLIDDFKTVPAFIEVEEAGAILQEYKEFIQQEYEDVFERRNCQKMLRKKMNPFIINVATKYANQKEGLWIIDQTMLSTTYDHETGFKRDPDINDFIL